MSLKCRRLSLAVEDAEHWLAIRVKQLEANRVRGSLIAAIKSLLG